MSHRSVVLEDGHGDRVHGLEHDDNPRSITVGSTRWWVDVWADEGWRVIWTAEEWDQ